MDGRAGGKTDEHFESNMPHQLVYSWGHTNKQKS